MPRPRSTRCVCFVEFSGQYIRTLGLDRECAVVYQKERVLDASPRARERGVSRRISLGEARLLLGNDGRFVEFKEEEHREEADRWLQVLLRYTDLIEPETACSAYFDLGAHTRLEEIAPLVLRELHDMQWLPMRAGLARSRWLARLSSQGCDPRPLKLGILPIAPVEDAREWLRNRRIGCLSPLSTDLRERMRQLGLQFVYELQDLPASTIAQQFGKQAPLIQVVRDGSYLDPVQKSWPADCLSISQALDECEDSQTLDHALDDLAMQGSAVLAEQDLVAGGLMLFVTLDTHRILQAGRELKSSVQTRTQILTHLRQLIQSVEIGDPVTQLRLLLADLGKSSRRQIAISYSNMPDPQLLTPVLRRIQNAYGQDAVVPASQLQISRERQVMKAWKEAYGWK